MRDANASNMSIQPPSYALDQPSPDARWAPGALAAQNAYRVADNPWGEPTDSYDPFAAEKFANPTVKGLIGSTAQMVATPGKLAQPNPYPAGSEQADYYDMLAKKTADEWARGMAMNTMGTGAVMGVPVRGAEMALGAGAVRPKMGAVLTPEAKYPQYAEAYPPTGPGVPTIDPKSGKPYMAKANTPEAEAFAATRNAIQKDMDANGYQAYFDPAQRFHADPSQYPPMLDTALQLPKKMETIEKYTQELDTPETRAALQRMYKAGQQVPNAENWYMMGQLEREYVKEFGPQIGREKFRTDFGGAMAATTGGADPTSNFLMGHYSNYLRNKGQDFPRVTAAENQQVKDFAEGQGVPYVDKKGRPIDKTGDIASYGLPFPIGGQYAAGNLDQYKRVFQEVAQGKDIAQALEDANPKRLDFMQSFTGNPSSFTWDKQMTLGATAGKYDKPPGDSYGIMERMAREEAAKTGVPAQNFQDVGWAGQKAMMEAAKPLGGKFQGPSGIHNFQYEGPMISHVNDAIERTHRLTGMPKEEIVRRGIVRGEIPIYGVAGGVPIFPMGETAAQDSYQ
jgi:hypothetical protein